MSRNSRAHARIQDEDGKGDKKGTSRSPTSAHPTPPGSLVGRHKLGCLNSFVRYAHVPYLGGRQMPTALFKLLFTAQVHGHLPAKC